MGLAMFEKSANGLEIMQLGNERRIDFFHAPDRTPGPVLSQTIIQLRIRVDGDQAGYFFSLDNGRTFQQLGATTDIHFSWWKGSRPSLFAYTTQAADSGVVDFDWAHYQPLGDNPW
jgi:Beta xylosidase C-terminal Concanavalin A-like domain